MAIDPIYIALDAWRTSRRAGGVDALSSEARERARRAHAHLRRVRYRRDAPRKDASALALAFAAVPRRGMGTADGPRARSLPRYISRERWWLDDYALYRAIAT